ncbi:hypothetical protein F511_25090 [Dorcoceras hygrometricum]|uniref:Uncharacterized protein n=1 Tax=Dorcoceras hygrometricum TaxID=472368 RepID=A0A2Z7AN71_9LAMI|nr:hypothetical protein F511_25090 [Dorcoceras hygrometricum]
MVYRRLKKFVYIKEARRQKKRARTLEVPHEEPPTYEVGASTAVVHDRSGALNMFEVIDLCCLDFVVAAVCGNCSSGAVSRGNRNFTVDCGRLRQSGPRPDTRLLRQPALEGLTRSARTDSPRQVGRNKFRWHVAATAAAHKGGGGGFWRGEWRRLLLSIGYPRMSASGESSTTMHRLLHASGSHPNPTPYDPKRVGKRVKVRRLSCRVSMTFRVVRTNRYNQDLGLIHSTNGNHLESPNEGSSIDHQVTIYLHAQNITMFPTNETWCWSGLDQLLVDVLGVDIEFASSNADVDFSRWCISILISSSSNADVDFSRWCISAYPAVASDQLLLSWNDIVLSGALVSAVGYDRHQLLRDLLSWNDIVLSGALVSAVGYDRHQLLRDLVRCLIQLLVVDQLLGER